MSYYYLKKEVMIMFGTYYVDMMVLVVLAPTHCCPDKSLTPAVVWDGRGRLSMVCAEERPVICASEKDWL